MQILHFVIYLTLNFSIPVFFRALNVKMRDMVWLICKHFISLACSRFSDSRDGKNYKGTPKIS